METEESDYYSDSFDASPSQHNTGGDTGDDHLAGDRKDDHDQSDASSKRSSPKSSTRNSPTEEDHRSSSSNNKDATEQVPSSATIGSRDESSAPLPDDCATSNAAVDPNGALFGSTISFKVSPLHAPAVTQQPPSSSATHRKFRNNETSAERDSANRQSGARAQSKLQKYAVEEAVFAPLHAAIDDVKMQQMVSRLYNPETLKHRTLLEAKNRRDKAEQRRYDSLQDAHLAEYWQRKQVFKQHLQAEKDAHDAHLREFKTTHLHLLQHRSGGRQRPASCPAEESGDRPVSPPRAVSTLGGADVPADTHGRRSRAAKAKNTGGSATDSSMSPDRSGRNTRCSGDMSAASDARRKRHRSRKEKDRRANTASSGAEDATSTAASSGDDGDAASSLSSSSRSSTAASSPEWEEQRPPRAASLPCQGSGKAKSSGAASEVGGASQNGSAVSRAKRRRQVTHIRRADLCALWMAARPPSPYQRLMSRLSFNPKQAFNLAWLPAKKQPPPGGTLLDIPLSPLEHHSEHSAPLRLSSPRSVYVLLKEGLSVADVTPVSLEQFYLDGSLRGVPQRITEVHFAARERNRQQLLEEAVEAYREICATISQAEFVEALRNVNPEDHREVLLSRETETICGGGRSGSKRSSTCASTPNIAKPKSFAVAEAATDPSNDVVAVAPQDALVRLNSSNNEDAGDDGAAARQRLDLIMKKQERRQEKYLQQLQRNAELLRLKAEEARQREHVSHEKHEKLVQQRKEEAAQRKEQQKKRKERLEAIRAEAIRKETERQQALLVRISESELHAKQLAKERHDILQLRQEERKIREEEKVDKVERREKQHDYENLVLIDKIRRKVGRATAMQEMKAHALFELKERREKNAIDMLERTAELAQELLEFERKHLTM